MGKKKKHLRDGGYQTSVALSCCWGKGKAISDAKRGLQQMFETERTNGGKPDQFQFPGKMKWGGLNQRGSGGVLFLGPRHEKKRGKCV